MCGLGAVWAGCLCARKAGTKSATEAGGLASGCWDWWAVAGQHTGLLAVDAGLAASWVLTLPGDGRENEQ